MKTAAVFTFMVAAVMFCTARSPSDYWHSAAVFGAAIGFLYFVKPEERS